MQKKVLELDKYNQYEPIENSGETLWVLEYFLHGVGSNLITSHIEWALDPTELTLGAANLSFLEKKNKVISISAIHSDDPDGGPFLELSTDQFVKLLYKWESLVKLNVKKIIITQSEDGSMAIEGVWWKN